MHLNLLIFGLKLGVSALPALIFGMETLNLFDVAWLFRGTLLASFFLSVSSFNRALTSFVVWGNERSRIRNIVVELIRAFSPHDAAHRDCGTGNPGVFQGYPYPYPENPRAYNPCASIPPKPNEKPRNSSAGVN